MFIDPDLRSNTPFGLTQDRIKLGADYTAVEAWKFNAGVDWDQRERSYQEVVTTRETTVWGRATWQADEALALRFDLAYGDRSNSTYGVAYWFGDPNNPLMRKYNLAERERLKAAVRADWAVTDTVSLGLGVDWVNDDYKQTVIGLNETDATNVSADIAVALSDDTQFHAFWQGEEMWSRQAGSQAYAAPDWTGRVEDRFQVLGFGIRHAAIPDKLDLGADVTFSRSDSDTSVQTSIDEPPFPTAETSRDVIKLYASYKINENLWLNGSYWYERYDSADWRLDGVQPDTVHNLLAFGNQAPQYRVNVFRVSVRYQF
ncbi:MAG TPA: MtrB/PioB family outer membrane beta-barrel protein [Rubrivivax sp.]|nr:MtrB/PioB family outer membrane beta-barrel protein [Rubrivivax sp.]